ncbi:hypothetical protein [Caballeronia sp. 15711]|uniref:hypothetical protein n=1 Tax=Caballeronia sp. 15711 TaxID=3391029 RepID=UPI0039E627E2
MADDDSARRIQDMQTVVHGIRAQLNAGGVAYDPKQAAAEIVELIILMETLLVLKVVDFHALNIARMLVTMNEPKVALDRLQSILLWHDVKLK